MYEQKTFSGAAPGAPAPAERMDLGYTSESYGGEAEMLPAGDTSQEIKRIVLKNASLTVVVDDPSKAMDSISRLAEQLNGFVVSANMYQTELASGVKAPRASITIRIPAEKLNDVLDQIKALSNQDALSESINSQDVTREYTDLQSRLRNLENYETQLNRFLEQAESTEDALNVYNQLVGVREQIEVIKGQIKYYDESAALSSVSVELIANAAMQPLTIGGWQPGGVARDAIQSLIDAVKFIINAVIWIVLYLLPVLLLIGVIFILPFILFFRWVFKRRAGAKLAKAQAQPPAKTE
jgi:hypothetical protein